MGRGRGKGKAGRGGKLFVANIEELQMREAQVEETKLQRYLAIIIKQPEDLQTNEYFELDINERMYLSYVL